MPALIILLIIGIIALWLNLSFVFKPFGKYISNIFNDAKNAMNEKDSDHKEGE